jgi:hypothetical protein
VKVLSAADEPDRSHPESPLVEGLLGPGDDLGIVRETQVVVGAEVDHFALRYPNGRALRGRDHALFLVSARVADSVKLLLKPCPKAVEHLQNLPW